MLQHLRMLGLLMLLVLLCDADRTCPRDNLLILDPPKVIAEYGEVVPVNCTSTEDIHEGMYWKDITKQSDKEYDESFTLLHLSLSDWTVTAECIVELDDTAECRKELDVTVYKNPDLVKVFPINHVNAVVEGAEYELQCDIIDVAPIRNLVVRWYKDDHILKTDNYTNTTKTPVSVSSMLAVSINRGDNGVHFRCEAQLEFGTHGPKPPVFADTHTISVHYADRTCPGDNLLILHPPKVIAEYGEVVPVNCTSTEGNHEGMYWKDITKQSDKEYGESFTLLHLSLSDWTVTAECIIELDDTAECRKELDVTVYKNPDLVEVFPIKHVNAVVEGAEYELQCDIIDVAPIRNLVVRWYKDDHILKTDNYTNTTKTPVSVSSMLAVSINRGDNGVHFRCEAQLEFGTHGPKPPVFADTHTISVHYPPEFSSSTTTDVYVMEGGNASLSCEAEGNPPPHFHWTCGGENMTENSDNLNTQVWNNTTCTCTATNKIGGITKDIHIFVIKNIMMAPAVTTPEASASKACPLTLMPAEIVVRFGDPASVNCSTPALDAEGMGWEAPSGGTGSEDRRSVTWMVEELKYWVIEPKCYISPRNDPQCYVKPVITVYKTPDVVLISAHSPMVEGTTNLLMCNIINVAPVQSLTVKWYRGSEIVHTHRFTGSTVGPMNVSTTFNVIPMSEHNGVLFRCSAELHLGPEGPHPFPTASSEPHSAIVHYKPLMKDCSRHFTVKENSRIDMLPCKADGNPPPTIHWYYQGHQINVSEPLTRDCSGQYTVEVENSLGMNETHVDITVEYSPSFTCNHRYEVEEHSNFQTVTCKADGIPLPTITWFKDGKDMVLPQSWTKHDSGNYKLSATNKHGTVHQMLFLDVLFAPEFKEGNISKEMSTGENVTITCHAEGNPVPEVVWKYTSAGNVKQTTGGSQRSVIVTGATSTNVGVYICVATNKVGSMSRSVTLRMKGMSTGIEEHFLLIYVLLGVFFFVLVITIIILCTSRNRNGQYSFVPNAPMQEIPMTPTSDGVPA